MIISQNDSAHQSRWALHMVHLYSLTYNKHILHAVKCLSIKWVLLSIQTKSYKTKITYSVALTGVCDKGDWNRLGLYVPISDSLHTISIIVPKVQQRVTKGIRLACITKVRQNSKKKTTNHHCILEQCKQIIFSTKHCFNLCLKADCEHSTSIFDSIISIHIFTPVYRMLRLHKFVLYSGIRKKFRCLVS